MIQVKYEGKWSDGEKVGAKNAVMLACQAAENTVDAASGNSRCIWFGSADTIFVDAGSRLINMVLLDAERSLTLVNYCGKHLECKKQEPEVISWGWNNLFGSRSSEGIPSESNTGIPKAPPLTIMTASKDVSASVWSVKDRPLELPQGVRINPHEEESYRRKEKLKEQLVKWTEFRVVGHSGSGMRVLLGNLFFEKLASDGTFYSGAHTIYHEVSHKALGAQDFAYGVDACKKLAKDGQALFNADNWAYFAIDHL